MHVRSYVLTIQELHSSLNANISSFHFLQSSFGIEIGGEKVADAEHPAAGVTDWCQSVHTDDGGNYGKDLS